MIGQAPDVVSPVRQALSEVAEPAAAAAASSTAAIGFGEVRHARERPVSHRFAYPTYFLMLPMRSLRRANPTCLAINRRALLSFHDADHGDGRGTEAGGALGWLDELLAAAGIHDADGEAWLHCYPRVFGYVFKPVSFWYCHTPEGALRAIVVEVNNTFGERHCYLLDRPVYGMELRASKAFHVSPFCEVRGDYRFRFFIDEARSRTLVRIDHHDAEGLLLKTSVSGELVPFDRRSARHALVTYPAMTFGIVARIHWQAARLWMKRVPWIRKPAAPAETVSRSTESMPMTTTTAPSFSLPSDAPGAARTVLDLLQKLAHGSLTVSLPDGSIRHFGSAPGSGPTATLAMRDWSVCRAALKSGDIGFAESYIDGGWTTPDLTELIKVFIVNRRAIEDVIYGRWFGRLLYRVRHLLHRNSKAGSSRNIHAHYDLGNAFYRLWLDETLNYSSAWFDGDFDQPTEAAQHAKVRRALHECGIRPGERLLEIGCGWGALSEKAAQEFGAQVTGVTLSTEQLAHARVRTEALPVELRLQDYRDIDDAPFDAICSIEMIEAVGREFWPTYFASLRRLLKPGGKACVQSIVIDDRLFDRYVDSTDFIQQYIFPGGCLPCPREFRREAEAAGLEVVNELAFGADYAVTLQRWREQFLAERARILQLGFDERFMRVWEFYLAYCEAAFAQANIDVVQYTLRRP